MSSAFACVRFPDGSLRWGVYHGTSDTFFPRLYEDPQTAWDEHRASGWPNDDEWAAAQPLAGPVEVYSDYGGGRVYAGRATPDVLVFPLAPYGSETWGGEQVAPPAQVLSEGQPDWVKLPP